MDIRRTVVASLLLVVVTGCGAATPSPAPSRSLAAQAAQSPAPTAPTAGSPAPTADAWLMAAIEQPTAVTTAPSLQPGYQCHPCHFLAEDQFFGVADSASGAIAVGVMEPPAQAIAYRSTDGRSWAPLAGFPGAVGTAAVAVASSGARTVIVGHDPDGATAWASAAGAWTEAPRQADLLVPYAAGGMTSVTAFEGGFVAGGYRDDPLHGAASAAVWRSEDGLTWQADEGSGSFPGGRIWGLAATAGTLVAVGTGGDPNYGPAAAWRWTRADGWLPGRFAPGSGGGAMMAVAVGPKGFIAVGLNAHDDGARVWTSPDGLVWTAEPDQPAFHNFDSPVRMQSIVVTPAGFFAGGWRSDMGKGSALTWASKDGIDWQATWQDSFSGGQITGLATTGASVVAVGRTGYPDWNTATIWRAPGA